MGDPVLVSGMTPWMQPRAEEGGAEERDSSGLNAGATTASYVLWVWASASSLATLPPKSSAEATNMGTPGNKITKANYALCRWKQPRKGTGLAVSVWVFKMSLLCPEKNIQRATLAF